MDGERQRAPSGQGGDREEQKLSIYRRAEPSRGGPGAGGDGEAGVADHALLPKDRDKREVGPGSRQEHERMRRGEGQKSVEGPAERGQRQRAGERRRGGALSTTEGEGDQPEGRDGGGRGQQLDRREQEEADVPSEDGGGEEQTQRSVEERQQPLLRVGDLVQALFRCGEDFAGPAGAEISAGEELVIVDDGRGGVDAMEDVILGVAEGDDGGKIDLGQLVELAFEGRRVESELARSVEEQHAIEGLLTKAGEGSRAGQINGETVEAGDAGESSESMSRCVGHWSEETDWTKRDRIGDWIIRGNRYFNGRVQRRAERVGELIMRFATGESETDRWPTPVTLIPG